MVEDSIVINRQNPNNPDCYDNEFTCSYGGFVMDGVNIRQLEKTVGEII